MEVTAESLLIQLGYPSTDIMLQQMNNIINNTTNFDKFSKHIFSLNDDLKHYSAYIAMSNSNDFLKIKTDYSRPEDINVYIDTLKKWSEKYKIELKRVEGKNTFYIIGQN